MSILEVNHIKKVYKTRMGGEAVTALRDVHFSIARSGRWCNAKTGRKGSALSCPLGVDIYCAAALEAASEAAASEDAASEEAASLDAASAPPVTPPSTTSSSS